jgi:hypothetical protein
MSYNFYNMDNCVNLTPNNNTVFWSNNLTNLIEVQPIEYRPFLTYKQEMIKHGNYSVLNYEWCGPLILLVKLFAQHINAKYSKQINKNF